MCKFIVSNNFLPANFVKSDWNRNFQSKTKKKKINNFIQSESFIKWSVK